MEGKSLHLLDIAVSQVFIKAVLYFFDWRVFEERGPVPDSEDPVPIFVGSIFVDQHVPVEGEERQAVVSHQVNSPVLALRPVDFMVSTQLALLGKF